MQLLAFAHCYMCAILQFQIYQKAALLEIVDKVHADIGNKTENQRTELGAAEDKCRKARE